MEYITLNNGIRMDKLGYGTYLTKNTSKEVSFAIQTGYRLIDTAQWYKNEKEVGEGIKNSGINRKEIFITSKCVTTDYKSTLNGINESIKKLGSDYIDLMIIHWPQGNDIEIYKALEKGYKDGKLKAIGISNFNEEQTLNILKNCEIIPAVNQIETHLYWQQKRMHKFLKENNIYHESYSPFGKGEMGMMNDKVVKEIAEKYNKTPAQIILKFLTQQDIIVIPKSSNEKRIQENFNIFNYKIEEKDIKILENLDKKKSCMNWPSWMNIEKEY